MHHPDDGFLWHRGRPDGAKFGDAGADTLGHIARWFARQKEQAPGASFLALPNLARYGLELAHKRSTGEDLAHSIGSPEPLAGAYTYAKEISSGKDTLSGHWELTGVPVMFNWGYFPDKPHCFPKDIIDRADPGRPSPVCWGKANASGTVIIQELGEEHMRTGQAHCLHFRGFGAPDCRS